MILENDGWIEYLNSLSKKQCELVLDLLLDYMGGNKVELKKEFIHCSGVNWSIYHKKPANETVKVTMMAFWEAKHLARINEGTDHNIEEIMKS